MIDATPQGVARVLVSIKPMQLSEWKKKQSKRDNDMSIWEWLTWHPIELFESFCYFVLLPAIVLALIIRTNFVIRNWVRRRGK